MELTSTFCRGQETIQRDRAANAMLQNVRIVAGQAAEAWRMVASAAEKREASRARARTLSEIATLQNAPRSDDADQVFSENPDRGMASA